MALDSWRYRDPAEVYECMEARTCKGCTHKLVLIVIGDKLEACSKGKKKMVRCKLYREKE